MSSLLHRLKAGKRNAKTVKFPGTDHDVMVRVLTSGEVQLAEFAAEKVFEQREVRLHEGTIEAYEKEKTLQMLHLALRDPKDPEKTFAASADELRGLIEDAERSVLVAQYQELQDECSPLLEELSEERFQEVLDEVKKSQGGAASSISNTALLQRLVMSLASPPATSPTDSGSTS